MDIKIFCEKLVDEFKVYLIDLCKEQFFVCMQQVIGQLLKIYDICWVCCEIVCVKILFGSMK